MTEVNNSVEMDSEQNLDHSLRLASGSISSVLERDLLRPSGTGNSLRFICMFQERLKDARRDFQPEESQDSVLVHLPARCSVYQLRLRICMLVQDNSLVSEPLAILDPERYMLLYKKGDYWYEIYDDFQVLQTLDAEWCQDTQDVRTYRILVSHCPGDTEERRSTKKMLTDLIGYDLSTATTDRLSELNFTRRKFAAPRREELQRRDPRVYALEPWTTSVPLTMDQPSQFNQALPVTLYYRDISFKLKVDIQMPASNLLKVFEEIMFENCHTLEYVIDDLVLKVCGREEFISGESQLSDFLWVRHCLKTLQEMHLSVLPLTSLEKDTVRMEDLPLVDSFTGLSSSHSDLTLANKDVDDVLMISLWDCERKFRVKLLGFDIPHLPCRAPQNVYVEASILYGNKVVSSVCSTPKPFAEEVFWNTWLEFDIPMKALPSGSRLGLTINSISLEGNSFRESTSLSLGKRLPDYQKGKGKPLYFVNLLLIDHKSILRQGLHSLHMWAFPEEEASSLLTYEADKLSSAANPDQVNSMAITFLLDRYSYPIVLPNSTSSHGPCSSPAASNVDVVGDATTSTLSMTGDAANLKKLKEQSVHYSANLPQYLRKVNWLKPRAVQDIHWFLRNWDPRDLDVPTALELLGVDFADEQVRKLAVQKLETLSNDDILRYLLQLVQTLKFEPYHDSFLARFLIQRALRSKRIGHYFFWYLRSEVTGSPYFRQRLAVVLEAYLLGCGQAMLDSFLRQVQLVESLQNVAIEMNKLFRDKTDLPPNAAAMLQDMLRTCSLPADFQVPFDPRVRAGAILLEKCKVMASKKKPLWLEFSSACSQGPPNPAVGIIFKHGDDLRQDMLVIQTLMIMDSIWKEKSLDLNLVPYGCIATGYNIGMIEIVRDAVTIATVQRSRGGTSGAFKTDALFDWLKGRNLLQEIHYNAMERFVTSCAGYCVATYVLGIGDRHNDNIMIMDQGNLFHIDFGHIMGNTKRILGWNRERVPFVLTPDFLYIMGRVDKKSSLYFQRFTDTCIQAYLALRCHSHLLVTLFSLMLLTGIPELSCAQDISYLREALQEGRSEKEAANHFLQQISTCEQKGWTVQTNWWIHMMWGIRG